MSRQFRAIGWLAPALFVAACGQSPPRPSLAEDLAAITEFNARYVGAINDGDIGTLTALTTERHVMLMPNRSPLVGKAANDAANASLFERFDVDEAWLPEETQVAGDWAYQRGTYTVVMTPKGGQRGPTLTGHYLRIYERQSNGDWRMIRDMFNSDRPPAAD